MTGTRRLADEARLLSIFVKAQGLGLIGPGDLGPHIAHAMRFAPALQGVGHIADLGSGSGLPALVLSQALPSSTWTLMESNRRRCSFLREAATTLGIEERVVILEGRVEDAARSREYRSSFDAVTARGFGRPAVVAECAAGLLRVGGRLVVSEPPPSDESAQSQGRWPADGLLKLGLAGSASPDPFIALMTQAEPCPERYPRRPGIPAKRPLF